MRAIKKILFVLLALIAIIAVVALFVDDEFSVVRKVEIQRSSDDVYEYVKHLKNQDNYSVWQQMDPDMKKSYEGIDGQVGFIAKWDSKNEDVGKGEQEIIKLTEGERIDTEIRFEQPFESTGQSYFLTNSTNNESTMVTWGFNGSMSYPFNLMMLFIDMDEDLGAQLQKGLDQLKEVLESEGEE